MLSVVIATHDSERTLLPTLAALVGGAVAGLVREVIVADESSQDATLAIAEDAGCRLLALSAHRGARLRAAAGLARADWLLFLKPGVVLDASWINEADRFLHGGERDHQGGQAAAFRLQRQSAGNMAAKLLSSLRSTLDGGRHGGHTLLIAKPFYRALDGHRDVDDPERDLARRLGRRRIIVLDAAGRSQYLT